jgi:hypothetical protein
MTRGSSGPIRTVGPGSNLFAKWSPDRLGMNPVTSRSFIAQR